MIKPIAVIYFLMNTLIRSSPLLTGFFMDSSQDAVPKQGWVEFDAIEEMPSETEIVKIPAGPVQYTNNKVGKRAKHLY